jgi:hypothetical protein
VGRTPLYSLPNRPTPIECLELKPLVA